MRPLDRPASPSASSLILWQFSVSKWSAVFCSCCAILAIALFPAGGAADERYLDFAHKLQEQGYADIAVEYLRSLETREGVPDEVKEVLDYEIGKTLLQQSEEVDPETERKLLDEAATLLRRFLDQHADSEEANGAMAELAGVLLKQGQQILGRAEGEKDAKRRPQLRTEARKMFEEAQASLTVAVDKYRQELRGADTSAPEEPKKIEPAEKTEKNEPEKTKSQSAKTKPSPKSSSKKAARPRTKSRKADEKDPRLEAAYIVARLNLGIAQFFVARTYDEAAAEKKQRTAQLDAAIETFDEIFQEYRGSFASFIAHLWHGRALEEQEDHRQALMIYDEILVNEPQIGERVPREQTNLFTQAQAFRLAALNRQQKHDIAYTEAELWVKQHPETRRTPHGLGIQLELAKAQIALGQQAPAGSAERRQLFARALQQLNNDVARIPSPYQNEAFRLRQEHIGEVTAAGAKIGSFDEGTFIGDAALGKENWADAASAYGQALALANDKTDPDELDAAIYRLSFALLRSGDAEKAAETAERLARTKPQSKWGPDAAAIALIAHSTLYSSADKDSQMEKINSIARHIEEHWPQHSQADVARRTMGNILLFRRDYIAAAEAFARIAESSALYADAQAKIGQAYWSAYLSALSAEAPTDRAAMSQWVAAARRALEQSVAGQKAAAEPNAPLTTAQVEAQLLLAEIELKTGGAANAAAQLDPLLPLIQGDQRKDLAPFSLRILVGAMEAAIAQQNIARAESLMADLEKQGGTDTTRITQVLVQLGRSLEQQLRQHEAAGRTAEAQAVRQSYESFLEKLGGRQQQTFASLQYLAESYFALGSFDRAADTFDRMIAVAKSDPAFAQIQGSDAELNRVKLRRATALRMTKQHALALSEVDRLLGVNARLLAAIMERGRILQDWSDENASKLLDAAKHWDQTSRKLQNISPRPAEYFEARHGLAACLAKLGRKDDAVRVLRTTLALSPGAGGPELKTKYESLLEQLDPAGNTSHSKQPAAGVPETR